MQQLCGGRVVIELLAWLVLCLIPVLAVGGAVYFDLRAWWRTRRNRNVLSCLTPRCVECARKIPDLLTPFYANAVQLVRCVGCGVYLEARRPGELWEIRTVAEAKRQSRAVCIEEVTGTGPGDSVLREEHA